MTAILCWTALAVPPIAFAQEETEAASPDAKAWSEACEGIHWSPAVSTCAWTEPWPVPFRLVRVKAVRGVLVNQASNPWPDVVTVAIELASVDERSRRYMAHADNKSGVFQIDDVQPGRYCLKIGVHPLGWDCLYGLLEVSETAPEKRELEISVPWGK